MKKIDPKNKSLTDKEKQLLMLQGLKNKIGFNPSSAAVNLSQKPSLGKKAGGMMKKKGYAKGKTVKPDFLDIDKDGDTTESMKAASGKKAGGMMKKKSYAKGKMVKRKVGGPIPYPEATNINKAKKKGMAKGGMMKKKGMAKGGMMKKKGMAKGGKVRGAGIAKKGVRPTKMR